VSLPDAGPRFTNFFGGLPLNEPSTVPAPAMPGCQPTGPFGRDLGLTRPFVEAPDDPRDADLSEHTFREMVRSRVYGLLAGYADLASQPSLSPFENAISSPKGGCPGLVPPERTCPGPAAVGLPQPAGE
jgi:hypothetical protein